MRYWGPVRGGVCGNDWDCGICGGVEGCGLLHSGPGEEENQGMCANHYVLHRKKNRPTRAKMRDPRTRRKNPKRRRKRKSSRTLRRSSRRVSPYFYLLRAGA